MTAETATAPAVPLVTRHQDTARLQALAISAGVHAQSLAITAAELVTACQLADPATIFDMLRAFQAQLDDTDRHAYAVIHHATAGHGYH